MAIWIFDELNLTQWPYCFRFCLSKRDVFRTLANIFDRAFLRKKLTAFNHQVFSQNTPSQIFDRASNWKRPRPYRVLWMSFLESCKVLAQIRVFMRLYSLLRIDLNHFYPNSSQIFPAGIYLLKVKNNTKTRCEICSKLSINEDANGVIQVSLLLTLNIFGTLF